MRAPVFIGDRTSAAGFRLGGFDTRVPDPGREEAVFRDSLADAALVILTGAVAAALPQGLLRRTLAAERPAILVVPDVRGQVAPPDFAAALKRQLGVAE
jgi:vacuolar-type H+-ATPase subunit F/Vma7